ncbi:MAG: 50S ribosomal protein L18, partial [Alphaproteobacteria bacterium]|nr:50S ribosomal protein L18 [Alphaproteobacteria bacterium]
SGRRFEMQAIGEGKGCAVWAASCKGKDFKGQGWNIAGAEMVGKIFAERMAKAGIKDNYYFDRGRYLYHGRVKALGDSMRANGMKI